jgi:hypothetical protein
MSTQDITRHLLQPGKHYAGVRMQQGRTILDCDWNEDALLEAEDWRATLADLGGAHGSPNEGFKISNVVGIKHPQNLSTYDFEIAKGSMFVGGMRAELDAPRRYLAQPDWRLQGTSSENLPRRPWLAEAPNLVLFDLVYLHVWDQIVSMVEDGELRERALGGPDTTTRVRRMARVEVATDVGSDGGEAAFEVLIERLEQGATFDREHAELVSDARLWVTPVLEGEPSPCGPLVTGGFLGHEHQAIRVELRGPRSFTWGFGGAAPLHRVQVKGTPSGGGLELELLTAPRDVVARPRAKQIIELLPRGAVLPNGEFVAELQGPLFRVISGYDPSTKRMIVDSPVPAELAGEIDFFMRVWDRGPDDESPAELPFIEGVPQPLGFTGLQVALRPSGRIGDHWIIAARKGAKTRVLPWELVDGAAPHGTRHFYAPLAIIRWRADGPSVRDVRRRLQPLCQRGCCTITVGDGVVSQGQVNSLADALALLPLAGGRICLLPGNHAGGMTLEGRSNVEIVGCGPTSVLGSPNPVVPLPDIGTSGPATLTIESCQGVELRNLAITAFAGIGVDILDSSDVEIRDASFRASGFADLESPLFALPRAALRARGVDGLDMFDCRVDVDDVLGYMPAVVLGGTRMRLHRNHIEAPLPVRGASAAMGGVHVLSQSSDVELVDNLIRGGWGHGITLGHVLAMNVPETTTALSLAAIWDAAERGLGEHLTHTLDWVPVVGAPKGALESGELWAPLGSLTDVRIRHNTISGMSLSGISSVFATPLETGLPMVVVVDPTVEANHVIGNATATDIDVAYFASHTTALGGIALAASIGANIRSNVVVDNGPGYLVPNCGVALVAAQGACVENNRIADNGGAAPLETEVDAKGMRGGIVVNEVIGLRGFTFMDAVPNVTIPRPHIAFVQRPLALRVTRNEVAQRIGKALWVQRGFGPIEVSENTLISQGDPIKGDAVAGTKLEFDTLALDARGACVEILCYGYSSEVDDFDLGELPTPVAVDVSGTPALGGSVLFCNNHTRLTWSWPGGYASAVLLSSLDAVVVQSNTMEAYMSGHFEGDGSYIPAVLATPASHSFLLVHCWVGASSTAQATGNRFLEGLPDAILSHLAASAITDNGVDVCTVRHALLATMNVATHCICLQPPGDHQVVSADNVTVLVTNPATGCPTDIELLAGPPQTISVNLP